MVTAVRRYGYARPTFARELLEAREHTDLSGLIGLAMRAHRREVGLSQRAFAAMRGWPKSRQGRLEACADEMKVDTVRRPLEGTGFRLTLYTTDP